jgi:hypothetical protein
MQLRSPQLEAAFFSAMLLLFCLINAIFGHQWIYIKWTIIWGIITAVLVFKRML